MDLIDRVREFIRRHDLAGRETRVVVALSGGSDSVALAHLIRALDEAGELRAAGAAHLNHQLRESADRDERFCAELAASFGWPLSVEREDIAARARRERRSIEDAARTARYGLFERARAQLGAAVVALGHTRDDQAETFLLRLLRGAGPRGLAAMHPQNGSIVRPLLSCRRHELRGYLAQRQTPYVEDESNADVGIPRNRIRAELLPWLEQRFNPGIVDVLADEADLAREVWQWMEAEADALARECTPSAAANGRSELAVAALIRMPLALRRVIVWRAMTDASAGRPVAFAHVEAALRMLESEDAAPVDVPGHRLERQGRNLVLTSTPPRVPGAPGTIDAVGRRRRGIRPSGEGVGKAANFFEYPLSIPGEVSVPAAGWILSAEAGSAGALDPRAMSSDKSVAVVRRDLFTGPLRVRNRRAGDSFRPLGLGGRKKLQDFFVDRKVTRPGRDTVPLVVDETDRIVWVAGYGIDEAFRVTDSAQAVLILKLKLLGGPA